MGQGHGGAQLLVGVFGIDTEAHVGLDRFIETGIGIGLDQLDRLGGLVAAVLDLGGEGGVALGRFGHDGNGVQATGWSPPMG